MSLFKIVRFVGLAVAAVLLLFVIGAIAFALTISQETIRAHVEKALSTNGRTVTIAGPVDVSFFPTIALSFKDFRMTEGVGGTGEIGGVSGIGAAQTPVVTIDKGTAKLKLLPLISGTAEYEDVTLTGLTVHPVQDTQAQKGIALTCNVVVHGTAHYDVAQGFTPEAIKRGVTSTSQLDVTDIVLLDKDFIAQMSKSFGGVNWEQFKSLSATITTKDGVAQSDNIALVGTNINASGKATVDLISNALNAGFDVNLAGLTIPLKVTGTTQTPIYTVESGAAINVLMKGLQSLGLGTNKETGTGSSEQKTAASKGKIDAQKALEGLGNFLNTIVQ